MLILPQDGRMDEKEVKMWIQPKDYDGAIAESKHLIHQADANKVFAWKIVPDLNGH